MSLRQWSAVPWEYAGKEVWVRGGQRDVEARYGAERIAVHAQAPRLHQIVTRGRTSRGDSARGDSAFPQDADPYGTECAGSGAATTGGE
jgi:hypothetical protein